MSNVVNKDLLNKLKPFVDELRELFSSEYGLFPSNSKYLVKRLEQIIEIAKTNSLLFASPEVKKVATGYVILLLLHAFQYPIKLDKNYPPVVIDLQTLEYDNGLLGKLIKLVKEFITNFNS